LLGLDSVTEDDYVREQQVIVDEIHPTEGSYFSMLSPLHFSAAPVRLRHYAPNLGEDTIAMLRRASYSDDEICRLLSDGVAAGSERGTVPEVGTNDKSR